MALDKEVYSAFENIVGPENMDDDPVILDSYAYNWLAETHPIFAPSKYGFRPVAVMLPGSAEEVQAIVKLCNRHNVTFKAHSTGYGIHAFPGVEGVLVMDLRRMNRIIDIDEKNKTAVVEPYVSWAELIGEILKLGLFTTPIQAGSQASVLANVSSCWGVNTIGNHGGHNGRNLLGVEWVLPTGEMLKLGPHERWFCSDGPGPSLRGALRGSAGHCGGLGVVTKAAIKLHNWPGPRSLPVVADSSIPLNYRLKDTSIKNAKVYIVSLPDWDHLIEFLYKVGDAQIGYSVMRLGGIEHIVCILPDSHLISDLYEMELPRDAAEMYPYPVIVALITNSEREFEYQVKVMDKIIEDCEGQIPAILYEPYIQEMIGLTIEEEFIHMLVANDTHFIAHSGGFVINAAYTGTCEAVVRHQGEGGEVIKEKYIDQGVIMDDGLDSLYHNAIENNAYVISDTDF